MPTPVSKRGSGEAVIATLCRMKFEAQCRYLLDTLRRDHDIIQIDGEPLRSGAVRLKALGSGQAGQGERHARH